MAKPHTTKLDIIRCGTAMFLEKGYSASTPKMLCQELDISPGNLTYYYPTKEHLLAELVKLLCNFQRDMIQKETEEGYSSIMAICIEMTAMAVMCEDAEPIREFFLSAYRSPMCLQLIRENDAQRAKNIFRQYCPSWTDEDFEEAEILVSGIEYATLMTIDTSVSLPVRIAGALRTILQIYQVPKALCQQKIDWILSMDYQKSGREMLRRFKEYVKEANEHALQALLAGN